MRRRKKIRKIRTKKEEETKENTTIFSFKIYFLYQLQLIDINII
jgi:hypothetical protein